MPGQVIACVAACLRVPVDDVEGSGQSACQPTLGQKPCNDEEGRYQHAVQCKHRLDVEKYCTVLNATRKHQLIQLPSKNIYYLQLTMEIYQAPTLRLKVLNKRTHIMYIEMENVIKKINMYIVTSVQA